LCRIVGFGCCWRFTQGRSVITVFIAVADEVSLAPPLTLIQTHESVQSLQSHQSGSADAR
jgi:hypothetical protein